MANIGIVGAGVAGLHLGLYLLKRGISPTIYTDRTATQIRASRLPSTTAIFESARAFARELGVEHWGRDGFGLYYGHIHVAGMPELSLRGFLKSPGIFVDMRLMVPRLLEDFEERGGRVVTREALDRADVFELGKKHDLMIVTSGRTGLSGMFPRVAERSPYSEPQRRLFAGLFRGIRFPDKFGLTFQIIPGHGEIFENQFLTAEGPVNGLLIEAIPGGALEAVTRARYEDDPRAFNEMVLGMLRDHVPSTYARMEASKFALLGPLDHLQGAVTPTARRGLVALGEGRFALALGDAHVSHDPVLGQGANAAVRGARALGEMLVSRIGAGMALDEGFAVETEAALWELVQPVTEWTNAFLQPPPPHMLSLLGAAAKNQALADAFISNFDDPKLQWGILKNPEETARFIASFS